jgi:hypothetical protein
MKNDDNDFDQEPPSYDHAFQTNIQPDSQVYQWGKFHDASLDSFERGEMFIQAFSSQIDAFPIIQAQEVGQRGLLNSIVMDTSILNNELFKHPKGTPSYITTQGYDQIQFWPSIRMNSGALEDYDVTAQASHPFLTISEYNTQTQYHQNQTQHYFEITVEKAGPEVVMAIGLCTRPYPIFRMPGWNKFSVGYHSDDGHKFCDDATGGQPFGPSWNIGDTIGCGYCPETGNVIFTKNGINLGYAFSGLGRHHYFASIGVDGPAIIHVNFGKQPFKYNVENWAGQFI